MWLLLKTPNPRLTPEEDAWLNQPGIDHDTRREAVQQALEEAFLDETIPRVLTASNPLTRALARVRVQLAVFVWNHQADRRFRDLVRDQMAETSIV